MAVTQIDIDQDALDRAMALSNARTKKDVVNLALRYYADFSEADIAKAMGISKGAVKSHTARAMSSLKTILTQETP